MKQNKTKQVLLFTLLALVTIPAAMLYNSYAIENQPQPEQQPEAVKLPSVTVIPVTVAAAQGVIQSYGEISAVEEVTLSSQVQGQIIWRNPAFVNGGQVAAGAELVRVDPTTYKAALANAEKSLADAALKLQEERNQKHQVELEWERSGLAGKPDALVLRKPQIKVAKASYQAAKAAVAEARRNLDQTVIRSPFAAVILKRSAGKGSYLQQGGAVATLQSSEQAEVSLALSAEQWHQLPMAPEGMKVSLFSRDGGLYQWQGRVSRLAATIDKTTRLRTLVVTVNEPLNQQHPLLFGSFVSVEIGGAEIDDLYALPASALTADGYIWWVKGDTLQRYSTAPLFSHDGQIYIKQGDLPPRIQVVRKPMASYLPDMKVSARIEGAAE
ncbi:efflux RND transporter periplasmic adaptor subunit [Endozoicomonadaceae bacterium StTr2]